jgi:hypothetical protein
LPRADYPWQDRQDDKRVHEGMHARIAEAQPGYSDTVVGGEWIMDSTEGVFTGDGIKFRKIPKIPGQVKIPPHPTSA